MGQFFLTDKCVREEVELISVLLSLLVLVLLAPAFYRVKNYNTKILLLVILEVCVAYN